MLFLALFLGGVAAPLPALCDGAGLPDAVARALGRHFPSAVVEGFGMESEQGVPYYEVHLTDAGADIEVEIALDGSVGETEAVVDLGSLPSEHQALIRGAVGHGEIRSIERHLRVGLARAGTFVPVAEPAAFYDVRYRVRGQNRSAQLPVDPRQVWALDGEDDRRSGDGDD